MWRIDKSPLRYPGGKSRGAAVIASHIPGNIDTLCSPFFGGGSVELLLSQTRDIRIYGYDNLKPLVAFWKCLMSNPDKLAFFVEEYFPTNKERFKDMQVAIYNTSTIWDVASMFYTLNRCGFSGCGLSGGMSIGHPRFTKSSISMLRNFTPMDNITVEVGDFAESIPKHNNCFLYCDPPYLNNQVLYSSGISNIGFNHSALRDILSKHKGGWVLSYNDCTEVRKMYSEYTILNPKWSYGMSVDKSSKELLIINK